VSEQVNVLGSPLSRYPVNILHVLSGSGWSIFDHGISLEVYITGCCCEGLGRVERRERHFAR